MTKLARLIDHTLLAPAATADDIARVCAEAREHGFASVCTASSWTAEVARSLRGSKVAVCAVVGFPHGNGSTQAKVVEAVHATKAGATELDMVVHQGHAAMGDWAKVTAEVQALVVAAGDARVKVILETAGHDEAYVRAAARAAVAGGAHFVKTSTGFGAGGATEEAVRWMRDEVGRDVGVKASGGIRDAATAERMVAAGANRLGCSSSVAVVTGGAGEAGY